MSFLKGRIQLSGNQERPSRAWSSLIPCCVYLNTKRIQLPDDSDDEQLIDEQDASSFEQQAYMPNNISIFKDQAPQQILSRNPFARATEEPQVEQELQKETQKEPEVKKEEEIENEPEEMESMAGGSGELVEFKSTPFTTRNYDNEPDWTELHDESDEEKDDTPKEEERIPQIEKEVLHLLPLTELSQEIPPNMILKRSSYEKSMYGEEPLTSGSRSNRQSSSTNRFSQISFSSNPPQEQSKEVIESLVQLEEGDETLTQLDQPSDPLSERRPSASTIQSFLGDQMDHLGEKLAFIKKNITMEGVDEEEEEEDNLKESNAVINKENLELNIPFHRRASSSLIEVAAPVISRFMTHINGDNDSLLSLLVESPTAEEDLFDLTKVFELGKDVKNYSEEFLDSGIRLFNDVANKVKNTVELENQRNFEEEDIDGNEWMHNYL